MKKYKRNCCLGYMLPVFILFIAMNQVSFGQNDKEDGDVPVTVNKVDLNRYTGTWYEIARIPNRFQDQCVKNVTATYEIREDGALNVINRCLEEGGSIDEAEGIAQVVDKNSFAKLEVSFVSFLGIRLFWGDYWILGLEENYNYAVVGVPSREYGWILSRTRTMTNENLEMCYQILEKQGYDPATFVKTLQE